MIDSRSPYFLEITDASIAYAILDLYVYDGRKVLDQPVSPEYTLRKNLLTGISIRFEISELVRDFLDLTYVDGFVDEGTKWVYYDLRAYDSSDVLLTSSTDTVLATNGYSYYDKTNERNEMTDVCLMTNDIIYVYGFEEFTIPVRNDVAVTSSYYNNGSFVTSQTTSSSIIASSQIAYESYNGATTTYNDYYNRVIADSGVVEDSLCLQIFINRLTYQEVDKIIISDGTNTDTITVVTKDECKYKPLKVSFVNKFGAVQEMFFFKKSVEKMNVKRQEYKSNVLTFLPVAYNVEQHRYKQYNANGMESITLSSGFVSEQYNEVFKQLMLSEQVWLTTYKEDNEQKVILPINIKSNDITYKTSVNDRLVEYTIEFNYAYDVINNIR